MVFDNPPVDFSDERLGICFPLAYFDDRVLVTLAVRTRDVVAETYVAALHRSVKLVQLTHNLVIKVVDSTVVLPQLLDALRWDKAPTNQFLEHALRYPLGILDITLVSGKLLDEIRVDELQAEVRLKHAPYGNLVNTRAFHPDFLYVIFEQQITHFVQFKGQHTKNFLNNFARAA